MSPLGTGHGAVYSQQEALGLPAPRNQPHPKLRCPRGTRHGRSQACVGAAELGWRRRCCRGHCRGPLPTWPPRPQLVLTGAESLHPRSGRVSVRVSHTGLRVLCSRAASPGALPSASGDPADSAGSTTGPGAKDSSPSPCSARPLAREAHDDPLGTPPTWQPRRLCLH